MKCPKCSYISFDYNQVCPKCNKDISEEQGKLNLPGYKPEPLFLLEALMGGDGDNPIDLESETFKDTSELDKEIASGMDDTGVMKRDAVFGSGAEEFEMEETPPEEMSAVDLSEIETTPETEDEEELAVDLEDLAEEPDGGDFSEETVDEPLGTGTVVLEDLKMPEDDPNADTLEEDVKEDEMSLDLDAVDDEGLESAVAFDEDDEDEEDLSLDLEELSAEAADLEEMKLEPMSEFEEEVLDLSDIDLEEDNSVEWDAESSHNESEMLTVELEEGKKKEPTDLEELHMEETADEEPDPSGS